MRKLIRKEEKPVFAFVAKENHRVVEQAVLRIRIRIRIRRIHVFLGLPDQDPLVRDMDPDPDQDPSHCFVTSL
jgi:hypothetical protein